MSRSARMLRTGKHGIVRMAQRCAGSRRSALRARWRDGIEKRAAHCRCTHSYAFSPRLRLLPPRTATQHLVYYCTRTITHRMVAYINVA